MKPRYSTPETLSERRVRDLRQAIRKQYSAEEKLRIVRRPKARSSAGIRP